MRMLKIVTVMLAVAGLLAAGDGEGRRCNLASLKGTYGTILTGTKPSGPPPAPLEQLIGVALSTFDGQGHSTGIDNIHGAISGGTPDRPGTGTNTTKKDCWGPGIWVTAGPPQWKRGFMVGKGG